MKNLLIMRHAKSDWANNLPDMERPLNKRGKNAAPLMAEHLKKTEKIPDLILSSPAKRAICTANLVQEVLKQNNNIKTINSFYFGYMTDIIHEIKNIDNKNNRVLIIGHNPVWEDLVAEFSKSNDFINMPTAAIASLIFDIDSWENVEDIKAKIEYLITPKGIKKE